MTLSDLSPRRRQIVELISAGLSDKEIGVELGIETQTVKNILKNIYRQTAAHGRIALLNHFFSVVRKSP